MAQKREKEETELKVPETLTSYSPAISSPPLSVPADQTAGSPSESPDLKLSAVVERKYRSERAKSDLSPAERSDLKHSGAGDREVMQERTDLSLSGAATESLDRKVCGAAGRKEVSGRREVSRCSGCRRKVGLMGFRCRCGEMFCSEHRYSDRHDCTFDYKAAGREAIARENPMVRAAKILKV
ncbi:hypothetical protein LguiA_021644 [Lonicera macranthoides]